MRDDGKTELQHYVPQLMLRLFASDPTAKKGTEQVWCLDKSNDKIFSPNIKGVLSQAKFYEIEMDGVVATLEPSLCKIEDRTASVLHRLIKARTLRAINRRDRAPVASFCAIQFVRTQALRDSIKNMNDGFMRALKKRGIDPAQITNVNVRDLSDADIKIMALRMLSEAPETYAPHFFSKYWFLIETDKEDPFYLGDHPIVLDGAMVGGPRGVGLASPGVTVYLPLCPTLCLGMADRPMIEDLVTKHRRLQKSYLQLNKQLLRSPTLGRAMVLHMLKESLDRVDETTGHFQKGTPSKHDPQVTMRVNSLQVSRASRWVVSNKKDFSLAFAMFADNEKLRRPPKMEVS